MNITAQEAKQIMDSEEGYIILDTRTQEEYDEAHIPGAIVIPHDEITDRVEEELTDKAKAYLEMLCGMFGIDPSKYGV